MRRFSEKIACHELANRCNMTSSEAISRLIKMIGRFQAEQTGKSIFGQAYVYNRENWIVTILEDYNKQFDDKQKPISMLRLILEGMVENNRKVAHLYYFTAEEKAELLQHFECEPVKDVKKPRQNYCFETRRLMRPAAEALIQALSKVEYSLSTYSFFHHHLTTVQQDIGFATTVEKFRENGRYIDECGREYANVRPPKMFASSQEMIADMERAIAETSKLMEACVLRR